MMEEQWDDSAGATGRGSLVGYVVAKYGTEEVVFNGRDLEMLKEWFEGEMSAGIGEGVVR
jgi:hypothetical protein